MKHLLNDMSQEEMNSIREQHTGGKKITVENFSNMVNKKLGEVPTLISESESELDEQGLGSRIRAGLSGNKANRDERKSERQDKRDARKAEREAKREARRKERDELVADNFGGYIQKLRDISNLYKRDIKGELKNMDLNQDEE